MSRPSTDDAGRDAPDGRAGRGLPRHRVTRQREPSRGLRRAWHVDSV
jgi:hypothetical protein